MNPLERFLRHIRAGDYRVVRSIDGRGPSRELLSDPMPTDMDPEELRQALLCGTCGKRPHSTLTDQCPHCGADNYGQPTAAERLAEKDREIERLRDTTKVDIAHLRAAVRADEAEHRASQLEKALRGAAAEFDQGGLHERELDEPGIPSSVYYYAADYLRKRLSQLSPDDGEEEKPASADEVKGILKGRETIREAEERRDEELTMIALALKNQGIEDCTPERGVEKLIERLYAARPASESDGGDGHWIEIEFDGPYPSLRLIHPETGCPLDEEDQDECYLTDWLENEGAELLRGKLTLPVRWEAPEDRDHPLFRVLTPQPQTGPGLTEEERGHLGTALDQIEKRMSCPGGLHEDECPRCTASKRIRAALRQPDSQPVGGDADEAKRDAPSGADVAGAGADQEVGPGQPVGEELPPQRNEKGGLTTFGLYVDSLRWALQWIDKRGEFDPSGKEGSGPDDSDWLEWSAAHDLLKDAENPDRSQPVGEEARPECDGSGRVVVGGSPNPYDEEGPPVEEDCPGCPRCQPALQGGGEGTDPFDRYKCSALAEEIIETLKAREAEAVREQLVERARDRLDKVERLELHMDHGLLPLDDGRFIRFHDAWMALSDALEPEAETTEGGEDG